MKPDFNTWFCAQHEKRQEVLREDKWMLAQAAFDAGVAIRLTDAPATQDSQPMTDLIAAIANYGKVRAASQDLDLTREAFQGCMSAIIGIVQAERKACAETAAVYVEVNGLVAPKYLQSVREAILNRGWRMAPEETKS